MKLEHLQEAKYAGDVPSSGWSNEKVMETFFTNEEEYPDEGVIYWFPNKNIHVEDTHGAIHGIVSHQEGNTISYSARYEDDEWEVEPSNLTVYETRVVYQ